VADRFALGHCAAGPVQGAGFAAQSTGGAAVGTGYLFAERLGLLFQQEGEGALGEARRSGVGQLLHGLEVSIQSGAAVAEGAAGDDFAPAGSEVADLLEEFGGKLTTCHDRYHLGLATEGREEFLSPLYNPRLGLAKLLMASSIVRPLNSPCKSARDSG
jgi:hypothetical protein